MTRHLVRTAGAAALALIGLTTLASCFSSRDDPMVGPAADCSLPLDGTVLGMTTTIVQIVDFAFVPAEVRIPAGTSVTWIYCEPPNTDLHTSTSDAGVWDSPLLDREETFTQTFDQVGSFPYHCAPHPFMKGTVIVE